jgi:Flp pilus assembly pilin Flp
MFDSLKLRGRLTRVGRFFAGEEALAITEYAMLVAAIAILLVAVVGLFGSAITTWFSARTGMVTTA